MIFLIVLSLVSGRIMKESFTELTEPYLMHCNQANFAFLSNAKRVKYMIANRHHFELHSLQRSGEILFLDCFIKLFWFSKVKKNSLARTRVFLLY